ncbi:MAG: hypothetical protein Q9165_008711 [Trypethelium subeluteriae]
MAYPTNFIQFIDPTLSTCTLVEGYRGVYDPPHALQPWPSAAEPLPNVPAKQSSDPIIPTAPATSLVTSPAAIPSAAPPTPLQTTYKPHVTISTQSSIVVAPVASQHGHSQGVSGDPRPNDPTAQTNQDPRQSQAAQISSAADVSSQVSPDLKTNPYPATGSDPKPDLNTAGNGQEKTLNNVPNPTDLAQSAGGHGEDSPQNAGSDVASILYDSEGNSAHFSNVDANRGQNPNNEVIANRPASKSLNNEDATVGSLLAYGGTNSQTSHAKPSIESDDSTIQNWKIIAEAGGKPIYALANDPEDVRIAGSTLHASEQTTIDGTSVSVHNGYIVIGQGTHTSTVSMAQGAASQIVDAGSDGPPGHGENGALDPATLPAEGPGAILTIRSSSYTALEEPGHDGTALIGSQTLSVGGPAFTIGGAVISYGSQGLVVDSSSTIALTTPLAASRDFGLTDIATISLNIGSSITAALEEDNGDVVIGTQRLSVGGSAVTVDGHVMTLGDHGLVIDGSSTVSLESLVEADPKTEVEATAATAAATIVGDVNSLVSGLLDKHGSPTETLPASTTSALPKTLDEPIDTSSHPGSAEMTSTKSGSAVPRIEIPRLILFCSVCLFTIHFS